MIECYQTSFSFPPVKHHKVDVSFKRGEISSDGGMLLLREIDKRLGLTMAIDRVLCDNHVQGRCDHTQLTMLRQRISLS
ncbi:transposase [Gynuella sp.]